MHNKRPDPELCELSLRDQEIYKEFNGKNYNQLCAKYDVSLQWLYKIIKYQQKAEIKRRQVDVFD